jgi:prepilin-type N-terminal cleavage/methylation domain-containing protein
MSARITKLGFTLIELLVVISIIAILAAIATVSYSSAQKQARDATRKSDLAQYRNSLEMYANNHNGLYPSEFSMVPASSVLCPLITGVATGCPEDPKNGPNPPNDSYFYRYQSTGTVGTKDTPVAVDYVLWTNSSLEASNGKWAVCSNGKSGLTSVGLPPSVNTGTCPF